MIAFPAPRRIAIYYHPSVPRAGEVARALEVLATQRGLRVHVYQLPEGEGHFLRESADSDLMVCVGGDGTVLHAATYAAEQRIPIFGVRMGRLGFLTETVEARAGQDLARVLDGEGRLEERSLVQAQLNGEEALHALNDVVIGRATLGRTVSVHAHIDGVMLAEYRADALVIATATGSTGYSLSVGGPILHPVSDEMILVPVAPHLTRANALVLPGETVLRLSVERGYEGAMSVDGIHHREVDSGAEVTITRSPRTVCFVRLGGENDFYHNLARRLGWLRMDNVIDEVQGPAARRHAGAEGAS
ncbi:MAG: NAD(+)/NADH kinase [Dehalococcoidia bacterium]|nr:NAD(+)/NADH kinase [Dehalococcoidia bacterium]